MYMYVCNSVTKIMRSFNNVELHIEKRTMWVKQVVIEQENILELQWHGCYKKTSKNKSDHLKQLRPNDN